MHRTAEQFAALPHEALAQISARAYAEEEGYYDSRAFIDKIFSEHAPLPEWCRENVLLSDDLMAHVFAQLAVRDAPAAAVCTLWSKRWKAQLRSLKVLRVVGPVIGRDLSFDLDLVFAAVALDDGQVCCACRASTARPIVRVFSADRREHVASFRVASDQQQHHNWEARSLCADGDDLLVLSNGLHHWVDPSTAGIRVYVERFRVTTGERVAALERSMDSRGGYRSTASALHPNRDQLYVVGPACVLALNSKTLTVMNEFSHGVQDANIRSAQVYESQLFVGLYQ